MKTEIKDEQYGEIIYDENFWTGKKKVTIGGVPLEKVSKKEFRMEDGTIATIKGGYLQGASLDINGKIISLSPRVKWYEILLCVLPLVLNLIWGNSVTLCMIIPVVGGAIGGAVSGLFCVLGLLVIKCMKPIWLKILIAICNIAIAFGICSGIAFIILLAMA